MQHYIDAEPNTDGFRQKFREIRDGFIKTLHGHVEGKTVLAYRACDIEGKPIKWVWDDALFKNAHWAGTIRDAEGFIAHMIDQGMYFAFSGAKVENGIEVWLTTWESDDGPTWPAGHVSVFQEVFEGISRV